jgi:hypothetical protein
MQSEGVFPNRGLRVICWTIGAFGLFVASLQPFFAIADETVEVFFIGRANYAFRVSIDQDDLRQHV